MSAIAEFGQGAFEIWKLCLISNIDREITIDKVNRAKMVLLY